jgi:CO/xanthine dehydrogenase FAD-binding subunit
MIEFDFEYYRPSTIEEAVTLYYTLDTSGKSPIYYSGGTEIITLARLGQIEMGAVIDIKGISECRVYSYREQDLVIGSSVTLTQLSEVPEFPLLGLTGSRVADHTARNKITIGGNICGEIMYREAVLPLLLAESRVVIAGRNGVRTVPILNVFRQRLLLGRGELLVQIITDHRMLQLPFFSVKKRKLDLIDYPLLTLSALKSGDFIRVAFSGLTSYPFRSSEVEDILNDRDTPPEERIRRAIQKLPSPVLDDWLGSADYRFFVLKNTLADMFAALEEGRYD